MIRPLASRRHEAGARAPSGDGSYVARPGGRRRLSRVLPFIALTLLLGCKELGIEPEPAPTSSGPTTELTDPNLKHWQVPATGAGASISGKEAAIGPPPTGRESPLAQPVIYQVASATPGPTAPSPPITVTGNDRVMINFVGADVHEVISSVLGDMLKLNYAIDPKVQGTVTFRTMSPIPKSDLLGLLEDMLALAGAAMVPQSGGYNIIPLDQASKVPPILESVGGRIGFDPGFGIHIIPVHFASPDSLKAVAEPMLPPGRLLFIDAPHHLLMYVGTSTEAQDVADLIATLDVDPMAGKSFAMFPVRYSDPEAVANELRMILVPAGSGAASNLVQVEPVDRMSAILVITSQPAYLQRAREWVSQLDHGDETTQRRLYVRYVQNGRAVDLARVLRQALGVSGGGAQEASNPVAPGMVQSTVSAPAGGGFTNGGATGGGLGGSTPTLGGGGTSGGGFPTGASGNTLGGQGGTSSTFGGNTTTGYGGTAGGDQTASADTGGDNTGGTQGGDQLRIVSDARNNALIIYANPKEYELIDQAMQRLDVAPLQVLIEATIAEVTLNNTLQYGLQWFFKSGDSSFTFSTLATGAVSPVFPGFNYVLNATSARIVLNALTAITQVKVISSPDLLVLDNGTGHLQVGDQVPIATQSAVSVISPGAPVVNSVDYLDTGVILNITPRVSSSGLVQLDIDQEVSQAVRTTSSDIQSPTIQQRRIQSSVAVNTGETIALGGLIQDHQSNTVTGIPVRSNIPILGNLFKTTDNEHDRTELLVLLSPKVIKNTSDARLATNELRQRLKGLQVLQQKMQ
ncbi:MAG TPA: type II secretion system secretin GspD [Dongiaceae bacterium]|nr:type II secretion system secretin GspD [Dongiaceae bacterium]